MTNWNISELELRTAIRSHPKMWVDPLYSEIGGVACIANMIDALLWGDYFAKPYIVKFTIIKNSVHILVYPGNFLLSGLINVSTITDKAFINTESIVDWIRNNYDDNEPSVIKRSKFNAITGVVYLSTSFLWEFDSMIGHFRQEYSNGIPTSQLIKKETVRPVNPTTKFSFSLKNGYFGIDNISQESVKLILSEFAKNKAIPGNTETMIEMMSSEKIILNFRNK